MAGDWIKLEHATPYKPEVTALAEYLGIKRREALGIILEYLIWLDQNLPDPRNAFVTHVSRKSLEDTFGVPGFASMLEQIGWAKFDDDKHTLQVIHADRHLGNAAKSRALNTQRQQNHRNAQTVTPRNATVTHQPLPEKRREEILKAVKPLSPIDAPRAREPQVKGSELSTSIQNLKIKLTQSAPQTEKTQEQIETERQRQLEAVRKATARHQNQAQSHAGTPPNPHPHTSKKNGAETILEPWEANDVSIMAKALELDIDIPQGATFAKVRELCRLRLAHQSNL